MAKRNDGGLVALKQELKEGKVRSLYLFYGEENYLKDDYTGRVKKLVPDGGFPDFNYFKFEGTDTELSDYDDAWEGFPMMSDRKLIIIKDSSIFKKANEEVKAFWQEKFKRVADDNVVVFNETEVDKRGVLYKAIAKNGMAVEFNYQSEADLVTWVNRKALKAKIKMSKDTAQYFVGVVDKGLTNLENEFNKLLNFCDGEILKSDIDRVVSKSMEIKVFDLTDAIMERNADKAMQVLYNFRQSSERGFGLMYLLEGSAEKLLKAKLLKGKSNAELAAELGVPPFVAGKYIKSASGFSEKALVRMITRIPEIDYDIKMGKIPDERTALEQYIMECIYYNK